MPYHDLADLYPSRLSEQDLVQLTNDAAGGETIVVAVYEEARADAEAEIDSYLGVRYALPLASTPAIVKRLSINMTIYELYRRRFAGGVQEGIRATYDDSVALLKRLAKGDTTLGVQPVAAPNSERAAQIVSHARVFSRTKLQDF